MDFSFYNMLIDISVLLYGVYGMIDWIRLIKAGKLVNSRLACPGGVKAEDCIDPKEYYELVKPKIFWFSLINIICGVTIFRYKTYSIFYLYYKLSNYRFYYLNHCILYEDIKNCT